MIVLQLFDRHSLNLLVNILIVLYFVRFTPVDANGDGSIYKRLRSFLLSSYDNKVIPSLDTGNATIVSMEFIPQSYAIDEKSSTFILSGRLHMMWTDRRLKWDLKDYENINEISLSPQDIWKPEFTVYNDATTHKFVNFHDVPMLVFHDGGVSWYPPTTFRTRCVYDVRKWPFDMTICVVRIGSWQVSGDDVFMETYYENWNNLLSTTAFNPEWATTLVTSDVRDRIFLCCPSFQEYRLEWTLQRRSGHIFAIIFVPAIGIVMTVLASFWIRPVSTERLGLLISSMMVNVMFLNITHSIAPSSGDEAPLAILFYGHSLALIIFGIFWTICSRQLATTNRTYQFPLSGLLHRLTDNSIVSMVLCLDERKFIPLDPEGATSSTSDPTGRQENWSWLAHLLDRIVFVFYLIIYIIYIFHFL